MSASVANACPRHPGVAAAYTCSRCQSPCCLNCCYTMPDSSICCSTCYSQSAKPAAASTPSVPSYQAAPTSTPGCPQHPLLPPISFCKVCGKGSCVTCDFFFPPNLHLCPICVTSAHTKLTPMRKKYLTMAIVMAVWSTIGMALLFTGAFASLGEGFIVDLVVKALVITPCSLGTGIAWAALKKGGPNPIGIWITLVWNSLLSGVMVLVLILLLFMR